MGNEKVVLRFLDGTILRGHIRAFSEMSDELSLQELDSDVVRPAKNNVLKAIFFVRTFEGNRQYCEVKSYGIRKPRGRRTFIKFIEGEDMVGFLVAHGAAPAAAPAKVIATAPGGSPGCSHR